MIRFGPPSRSPRFDAFVAPAKVRPQLWRLVLGVLIAGMAWVAAAAALILAFGREGGAGTLLAYLYGFAGLILGLALAARLVQKRDLASLIGPGGIRPDAYLAGIAVVAALALPGAFAFDAPERQLGLAEWAAALPLAIPALAIQTGAEEMLFRGYLAQSLAARFRSRIIWWILPALLFGIMHWNPPTFGPNAWLVVVSASLTGLILADVTIRFGNLSLAMGLHFANNAIAILIVAPPSPLSGLALYVASVDPADTDGFRSLLLADIGSTALLYALWLGFNGWRDRRAA